MSQWIFSTPWHHIVNKQTKQKKQQQQPPPFPPPNNQPPHPPHTPPPPKKKRRRRGKWYFWSDLLVFKTIISVPVAEVPRLESSLIVLLKTAQLLSSSHGVLHTKNRKEKTAVHPSIVTRFIAVTSFVSVHVQPQNLRSWRWRRQSDGSFRPCSRCSLCNKGKHKAVSDKLQSSLRNGSRKANDCAEWKRNTKMDSLIKCQTGIIVWTEMCTSGTDYVNTKDRWQQQQQKRTKQQLQNWKRKEQRNL